MSTIFDVPMHDFSGEGSMDTDMLPFQTSDVDWLQVENMIEDDVSKQSTAREVEMIRETAIQDFEMEVAGDVDVSDYVENPSTEHLMPHSVPESFDQEIPDASRATTPTPTPIIQSFNADAQTADVSIIREADEGLRESDPTSLFKNVYTRSVIDHDAPDQQAAAIQTEATESYVLQETPDINHEEYDQQLGHTEDREEQTTSVEVVVVAPPSDDAVETISKPTPPLDEGQVHHEEYHESSDKDVVLEVHDSLTAAGAKSVSSEHASLLGETQLSTQPEEQSASAATNTHHPGEESEEPLVEPSPCVLLAYLFDGSHYCLFRPLEKNHPEIVPVDAPESKDFEPLPPDSDKTESQNVTPEVHPVLLFADQSDLFYTPLSQLFQAIRNESSINVGGRFDENIELVITAVGLDLRLPEDNIHTREVSLNDLSVLHTGCELIGPLSLQLDTIAPRFGTRYKAIRDALVSIVSSTDDHVHDQERILYTENQEDPDVREHIAQEGPSALSSSENINDSNHESVNVMEEAKEAVETRASIQAKEIGEDEEAENLYDNETENEGIDRAEHTEITEITEKPDDVPDEYYDEDAEGEYEEEGSYESTHDVDTLYHFEIQDEATLLDENPQAEEIDVQDPENETYEDHQYLIEGPIQDGVTPEPNSPGSEAGSLYEASIHEEGVDNNTPQNDDLTSTQTVFSSRARAPSSKRSFDEHEIGQYEEEGGSPSSTGGVIQKRSRLN